MDAPRSGGQEVTQVSGFGGWSNSLGRVEAKDRLSLFHHVELIASDCFDVFLIIFEQVNFAFAMLAQVLFGKKLFALSEKATSHLVASDEFGIEPEHEASDAAYDDERQEHAIERVPEGRIACASRLRQ